MKSYIHTINPVIANTIGASGSILLNQLEYWLSRCGKNVEGVTGKWIYNSHKQWSEQFSYWSLSKVRRTIKSLEDLGVVKSIKANAKKWDQTKYYSIDYSKYKKLLNVNSRNSLSSHSTNSNKSITKKISELKSLLSAKTDNYHNIALPKKNSIQSHYPTNNKRKILTKSNVKNTVHKLIQPREVCICSKRTNQYVQNEQFLYSKNNFTKNNVYKKKDFLKNERKNIRIFKTKKSVVDKMIIEWNNIFEFSNNPIKAYSNSKNTDVLFKIFKKYFSNNIELWKEYALKVNSSKFLMGEKKTKNSFKATFIWLTKPDIVEKIMNNEYGVGDREIDMNNASKNIEIKKKKIIESIEEEQTKFMKKVLDNKKERMCFNDYMENLENNPDQDEYNLTPIIRKIASLSTIKINGSRVLKKNLYENYIMKKYMKMTKIESRQKLNSRLNELIKNTEDELSIVKKLNQKAKNIRRSIISDKKTLPNINTFINNS